jgi:hypothetical protein
MKGLTSPEGILMLCVAGLLDIIGLAIFILGTWFAIDDYGVLDIIGGVIMGCWMLLRYSFLGSEGGMKTENLEASKQAIERGLNKQLPKTKNTIKAPVKNLGKKAAKRFGLNFLLELIPFLGGLYPGWTMLVYKEMKE